MRRTQVLVLYSLILLFSTSAFSKVKGPQPRVHVLHHGDGLASETVWRILHDQQGYIWLGTSNGLQRFDGLRFKTFQHKPDQPSLSDNLVKELSQREDGKIWVGTALGLNLFDPMHESFETIFLEPNKNIGITCIFKSSNGTWFGSQDGLFLWKEGRFHKMSREKDGLAHNRIRAIFEDSQQRLWIGTDHGLNLRERDGSLKTFLPDPQNPRSISHAQIRAILEDDHKNLWIGTSDGLNLYQDGAFQKVYLQTNHSNLSQWVNTITKADDGDIWVATREQGISRVNAQEGWQYQFSTDQRIIPSNNVVALYACEQGLLWVGTFKGGLGYLDLKPPKFKAYPNFWNSFRNPGVASIFEEAGKRLWVGSNANGLVRYEYESKQTIHYTHDPKIPTSIAKNTVLSITGNHKGSLWIGYFYGGLDRWDPHTDQFTHYNENKKNPGSLPDDNVISLHYDQSDRLWVGTRDGLALYQPKTDTFQRIKFPGGKPYRIHAIAETQEGDLWLGTTGLFRYNPDRQQFSTPAQFMDPQTRVLAIHIDDNNAIWLGTTDGLRCFQPATGEVTVFTTEDGLPSAWITGIVPGIDQELWLGTNAGLVQFRPGKDFKVYNRDDGLLGRELTKGAFYKNQGGEIFIGGPKGVNSFFPDQLSINPNKPKLAITGFKVFNSQLPLHHYLDEQGTLNIDTDRNHFSFEFAVLDYTNPEKNHYAYRLLGLNNEWIYPKGRQFASYTNLAGGNYIFELKGANDDGVWSDDVLRIPIRMIPPIWERPWFNYVVVFLILNSFAAIHMWRTQRARLYRRKLEATVEERTQALKTTQNQLMNEALKAGVSEITTDVLHNMGNLLNSAKVSCQVIVKKAQPDKLDQFSMATQMLQSHEHDFRQFLTKDPKGKLLPTFFNKLEDRLTSNQNGMGEEVEKLYQQIKMMDHTMAMEQDYAKITHKKDHLHLPDLVLKVHRLQEAFMKKDNIRVLSKYEKLPPVYVDPFHLIQVLYHILFILSEKVNDEPEASIMMKAHQKDRSTNLITFTVRPRIDDDQIKEVKDLAKYEQKKTGYFSIATCITALDEVGGKLLTQKDRNGLKIQVELPISKEKT